MTNGFHFEGILAQMQLSLSEELILQNPLGFSGGTKVNDIQAIRMAAIGERAEKTAVSLLNELLLSISAAGLGSKIEIFPLGEP